jgi:hypothetical protein
VSQQAIRITDYDNEEIDSIRYTDITKIDHKHDKGMNDGHKNFLAFNLKVRCEAASMATKKEQGRGIHHSRRLVWKEGSVTKQRCGTQGLHLSIHRLSSISVLDRINFENPKRLTGWLWGLKSSSFRAEAIRRLVVSSGTCFAFTGRFHICH